MSTSTIFIKRPLNYRKSLALLKEKYREFSPILSGIMWVTSGLYTASESSFNANLTGITLAFPVYQLLSMFVVSLLLCKGLHDENIALILPWIGATSYSIYYNHYHGLLNTLENLRRVKKVSWLPWSNLSINILLLIIRGTLAIRVFQVCVHMWFKKKLKELKDKDL